MKRLLFLLFISLYSNSYTQNFIANGDFELYSSPPNNQAQVSYAVYWDMVVQSGDYMNSGFNGWCPHHLLSKSGNGYMGFATYGLSNPAAEAIGQDISINPLIANTQYDVGLYAKKALSSCWYHSNCGGVAIYGFTNPPPLNAINVHVASYPGAYLLWTSNMVTDSTWSFFSGTFIAPSGINYIVLTNENIINCPQYVYVDSFYVSRPDSLPEIPSPQISIVEFPNVITPNNDNQNDFFVPMIMSNIFNPALHIFNRWGQLIYESSGTNIQWNGNNSPDGVYYWFFTYTDAYGHNKTMNGYLTLLN